MDSPISTRARRSQQAKRQGKVDPKDRISAVCWAGKCQRCYGRIVTPKAKGGDQELPCSCDCH